MVFEANIEQKSGGKKQEIYCRQGDSLFLISDRGNVLIVMGKNGKFPIRTEKVNKIMMTPAKLIKAVKEVDEKIESTLFPYEYVLGILENYNWGEEFKRILKNSPIKRDTKRELLKRYENRSSKRES